MSNSTGVKTDAFKNYGTASGTSGALGQNAQNLYGSLAPTLQTEAVHPQGYTPSQKAAIDTSAQQSAGGSMSGATGQGALLAARTRNAGAAQNAIQQAGRQSSQNLSNAAVGTQVNNANLQQKQQQAGLSGLEGLNSTELGGSLNALGLSNQALNTANQAKPSFWSSIAQSGAKNLMNAGLDAGEGFAGF
jgi:hypothetical protein